MPIPFSSSNSRRPRAENQIVRPSAHAKYQTFGIKRNSICHISF